MASKPSSEFLALPFIADHLGMAARYAGRLEEMNSTQMLQWMLHSYSSKFDSPLEVAYWMWWSVATKSSPCFHDFLLDDHVRVPSSDGGYYVLDFVVGYFNDLKGEDDPVLKRWPRIAIELDGHTFHEKTLEQVTRRNQRDRDLQRLGWKVFHYSFDEFSSDPCNAVLEPLSYAVDVRIELQAAVA